MHSVDYERAGYLPDLSAFFIEMESRGLRSLAQILPIRMCPYLLHTLVPYIITLSHGGVFTWMLSEDPNSVTVQCPNPNGSVSCRLIRRNTEKSASLSVNIESVKGRCPFPHFSGQAIDLPRYEDRDEYYQIFDAAFPWILHANAVKARFRLPIARPLINDGGKEVFYLSCANGEKDISSDLNPCSPKGKIGINLNKCASRCRYHKFPWRDSYNSESVSPDGLCPDLFHAAYPQCLMKLYESGTEVRGEIMPSTINCPNSKINVRLSVRKKPMISSLLRLKIMELMRKFGKNTDLPLYRVSMDIIHGSDKCPRMHRDGQHFELNLGFGRSICPATFDAIYPFLHSLLREIEIPKVIPDAFGGPFIQCPDEVKKNIYTLCGEGPC